MQNRFLSILNHDLYRHPVHLNVSIESFSKCGHNTSVRMKICIQRNEGLVERFIKSVKMCFICFVIIDILSYYISKQFAVMLNYIKLHIIKNLF